ncbi:DUF3000 domain-containing protein [Streptomyces sp. NPDC051940]|uniref:DUF3000 domain-containing protein n=1 Tax=Streptomyces sp. NPDC051940 TaxID=3155675 RepID=UPI00344999BF
MAAAPGHLADDPRDTPEEDEIPLLFRQAVEALRTAPVPSGMRLEKTRAPRRLAPYAYALEAAVLGEDDDEEEAADGRLVLLHHPDGHEAWRGTFRLVTLVRAELEPEMAADPLLPEVCWSWLTGALDTRGVSYREPSGTVTRAGSYYFGGMATRAPSTKIEIRASWTPHEHPTSLGAHLTAWCELLRQCAGLPPAPVGFPPTAGGGAVVPLPQRRGPRTTR